jgi:hypothetical protein
MFKEVNRDIESAGKAYSGVKPSTKVAIWIIIITLIWVVWGVSGQNYPDGGLMRFADAILQLEILIGVPYIAIKLFTKII